jgi:hydroxymethylpyrimidine pyrophosphatase-like HAD family hydrolase
MKYHAFITDYDGTLTAQAGVNEDVIRALELLKITGRKLILVTGRRMVELISIFPQYHLFDRIVAENGALIFKPETMKERLLGELPPPCLLERLNAANIPIVTGKVIVATWEPHEIAVLEAIRDAGLEYQVIFNKGAVMVLPPGINKATGLSKVLEELSISPHNSVAIGDAENDIAMLQFVECAVAVNNALPTVKGIADWITEQEAGSGVKELINKLITNDLADINGKLYRHFIELGTFADGGAFRISPFGHNILVAGTSGAGKTTLATAFLERLIAAGYQFCLIDPEGDYQDLEGVMMIGDSCQVPLPDHVTRLLSIVEENAVVCLLGVDFADRPAYFNNMLPGIMALQKHNGHPHFLIMDEAHHLIPARLAGGALDIPETFVNIFAITTVPEQLSPTFLRNVDLVVTIGEAPASTMKAFADAAGVSPPGGAYPLTTRADLLVWDRMHEKLMTIKGNLPNHILMRHKRKYATGDMAHESFYFRGPERKLNLRASNLVSFIQLASGVDDATWLYHLLRHDYSNWFSNSVKDNELALAAKNAESVSQPPDFSRRQIIKAILERYTLPA